jgi:hypothetical protein
VCARGVLTRDEAIELGRQIREHADFDFLFSELLDLSMLETHRLEYQDLVLLSDRYDPFSRWSKRAFVAKQGGDAYELARTYRTIREPACIEIFPTKHEAIEWLDIVRIR